MRDQFPFLEPRFKVMFSVFYFYPLKFEMKVINLFYEIGLGFINKEISFDVVMLPCLEKLTKLLITK